MGTKVEYVGIEHFGNYKPTIDLVGNFSEEPNEALKTLLPRNYVVDFLDVPIPSKSEYINLNWGLKISPSDEDVASVNTLESIVKHRLNMCFRRNSTPENNREIYEFMESGLVEAGGDLHPMSKAEAEKYHLIFEVLGSSMPMDDLMACARKKEVKVAAFPDEEEQERYMSNLKEYFPHFVD